MIAEWCQGSKVARVAIYSYPATCYLLPATCYLKKK
jgi:hypothetical protein